ncbi:uncharacterized protein TNCV_4463141 [Trichonephila clavipes]|nr:uncharacterized protein TNCV_4463141 [Trichonephila clavipes]
MLQKSPFAIHKAIQGISGEPKSVKKLRSGDLLIETSSALQTKSLANQNIFRLSVNFAKPSIATSTTQTDENITKVKCPPLQILKPLLSVPHPNASPSITSNSTSSSTTQVNLLPSASSIKATTQTESRLPEPISSAAAPDNSLNTSASSLSTETRLLKTSNKFAALSTEIQSLVPQVHLLAIHFNSSYCLRASTT